MVDACVCLVVHQVSLWLQVRWTSTQWMSPSFLTWWDPSSRPQIKAHVLQHSVLLLSQVLWTDVLSIIYVLTAHCGVMILTMESLRWVWLRFFIKVRMGFHYIVIKDRANEAANASHDAEPPCELHDTWQTSISNSHFARPRRVTLLVVKAGTCKVPM